MRIDQWVQSQSRFLPDKVAIAFRSTQESTEPSTDSGLDQITYKQLEQRVSATAALLVSHWQLNSGDRIAWLGLNHPDMFVVLLAAARMGIVVVPMSWRLSVDELLYIVNDCEPKVLFHDQKESTKTQALVSLVII